jgi:hypothetical protein
MTISEVRRRNIHMLVEEYGGQSGLSKATQKAPAYISQLVSGIRNLGEASCRSFETELGLPKGWFDIAHIPTDANAPFPLDVWATFPPQTRAFLLGMVEFFRVNGAPEGEEEARLLAAFRACSAESRAVVISVATAQAAQNRKAPRAKGVASKPGAV